MLWGSLQFQELILRIRLTDYVLVGPCQGLKGTEFDVEPFVAEGYVSRYLAEYVDQPEESPVITLEPASEPEPVKRPYSNATKTAWIEWAVDNGCDRDKAEGMTKTQLMSEYGERL
jgi:hypothetical protein